MQTTKNTSGYLRMALAAPFALAVLNSTAASLPDKAAEMVLFNGKDLAGWRDPAGTWQVVGAVPLDKVDDKNFAPTSGTGVLINSATNNTVNLLTEAEYG